MLLRKIKTLSKFIGKIFTLLYYLPGFIQKPAIHYKIDCNCKGDNEVGKHWKAKTEQEIEDSLINTYHEKVKDFINSRKKKVSL